MEGEFGFFSRWPSLVGQASLAEASLAEASVAEASVAEASKGGLLDWAAGEGGRSVRGKGARAETLVAAHSASPRGGKRTAPRA